MSYRLISSNDIAIKYPEVNDMPCIYADLPNGMDGEHYVLEQEPCEMTAEEYRQRMIRAFHNADTDELIAICVLPTEKEFEHLEWLLKNHYKKEPCGNAIDRSEAIKVASGYCHPANVAKELAKLPPVNPQPCGDAISRQAVIDGINRYFHDEYYQRTSIQDCRDCLIEDVINELPPVNPTKTGHWVGEDGKPSHLKDGMTTKSVWCSECGKWLTASDEYSCDGKFCPNCGAKIVEPQERSDKE